MNTVPRSTFLEQHVLAQRQLTPQQHAARVWKEMLDLGATSYGIRRFASKYLPRIIHPDEALAGIVYGHSKEGAVILVATDRRVIYLDKKPFFVSEDEVTYNSVSGVSYGRSGFYITVTLHSRIGDYEVRTFNQKCAENFIHDIESRCLERQRAGS